MTKALIFSSVMFLAACALAQTNTPPPMDLTPRCGADQLKGLIGQDSAILREIELPENLRVVHPGMMLTQDYQPARLNIAVDKDGIINRVWCS